MSASRLRFGANRAAFLAKMHIERLCGAAPVYDLVEGWDVKDVVDKDRLPRHDRITIGVLLSILDELQPTGKEP